MQCRNERFAHITVHVILVNYLKWFENEIQFKCIKSFTKLSTISFIQGCILLEFDFWLLQTKSFSTLKEYLEFLFDNVWLTRLHMLP